MLAITSAQIRIYSIERVSASNGAVITFKNFGDEDINVTEYNIGTYRRHIPIHSTENNSLEAGGVGPIIPPNETWSIDYTPWARQGSGGKLSQSSDISLWINNGYLDINNMIDFLQYCNTFRGTTCPDYGEYTIAAYLGLWNNNSVIDRHVSYIGPIGTLTFNGNVNDRGRQYWSSVSATSVTSVTPTLSTYSPTPSQLPTTSATPSPIPCQALWAELLFLIKRLLSLKNTMGC